MGGICGVWDSEENIEEGLISSMSSVLSHRGPDSSGTFVDKHLGLGSKRLSIIDSNANQPIHNEDKTLWIIYNGEFYNFRDERAKLAEKGHRFYTNSDSEVVLHLYEEYGSDCVLKMNGGFAFVIYDSSMKRLFLARDRLGIKPLVYFFDGRRFAFASELKSLLQDPYIEKEIDLRAVNDFFRFSFIPAPNTIFKNIKKLPPAHTIIFQHNKIYLREYWDVDCSFKQKADLESELRKRLKESVKLRLTADAPLAAFLSASIESSAIVGFMNKLIPQQIKTFSISFDDKESDDLKYAKIVSDSLNTEHKEFIAKPITFDLFAKLVYYLDEPFADPSILPTYIISNLIGKHVKVMLTGHGCGELFAADERYKKARMQSIYSKLPGFIRDPVTFTYKKNQRINRTLSLGNIRDDEHRFFETNSIFRDEERHHLLNNPIHNPISIFHKSNADNLLDKQLYTDLRFSLPNQLLKKLDTVTMANSLEARTPFLDHNFVEFAVSIPANKKMRFFDTSHVLKKALSSLVPEAIINKKKQEPLVPLGDWFRNDLKDIAYDLILGERAKSRDYFDFHYVEKLWNQHQNKESNHDLKLFSLAAFELWNRVFIDEEKPSEKSMSELI